MREALFYDMRKKALLRTTMLYLGAIALFYAAVATPIYASISSDKLLQSSVVALIWDTLMSVCNYLFYWISFSVCLYALIRYDLRKCLPFFLSIASLSIIRYFANYVAGSLLLGFQSINVFLILELPYILLDIVLEIALIAISVAIMHAVLKGHVFTTAKADARTAFLAKQLPFNRLFDLKNPIGKAAILAALIPSSTMLVSQLIYVLSLGTPQNVSELLWMIEGLLFDIVSVFIGYAVIVWIIHRIYTADLKAKQEFETD